MLSLNCAGMFMDDVLLKRYEGLETGLLIRIAYTESDTYQEEAVELAKKVLESRNITQHSSLVTEAQTNQEIKDNDPLSKKQRIIFFLCGMFFLFFFFAVIYIEYNKREKGIRRTKEAWRWLWIGLATMIFINILGGLAVMVVR